MKVKVIKANLSSYWYADRIGKVYDVEEVQLANHKFEYKVIGSELVGTKYFDKDDVEIIDEEKFMKKSDLKSGMHVELRNGHTYMVLTDGYYGGFCLVLVGAVGWANDVWNEDMTCRESNGLDIMKVHTTPIYNVMEISNQRKLVWERVEQTPEQKQLQEVMTKISELQDQANKLQELVNK